MGDVMKIVIPIALAHAAVLAVILLAIKYVLKRDTRKAVATVRQAEAEVRKKEEGIVRRIEEHEAEFARKKAEADEDLQKRKQESEREVRQLRDKTITEAKTESDQILKRAKQAEEKMRQQLLQEAEERSVDYAGQIFRMVFSEKMSGEVNRQFIGELLDALEQVDAASITVDPTKVEFRSSAPLPPDQKKRLQNLLKEKFDADVPIMEKVDEQLMGGVVFKLGSLEIDGSLRTRYQEAVAEVKKTTPG
ncbi:MAG: F0F1 ATP synthase subunit delta [Verrucomicrobiota bacterium]|nr:F0F1 ATP synthase subunit delta [Verrucomicrobiota bacterium]